MPIPTLSSTGHGNAGLVSQIALHFLDVPLQTWLIDVENSQYSQYVGYEHPSLAHPIESSTSYNFSDMGDTLWQPFVGSQVVIRIAYVSIGITPYGDKSLK